MGEGNMFEPAGLRALILLPNFPLQLFQGIDFLGKIQRVSANKCIKSGYHICFREN